MKVNQVCFNEFINSCKCVHNYIQHIGYSSDLFDIGDSSETEQGT